MLIQLALLKWRSGLGMDDGTGLATIMQYIDSITDHSSNMTPSNRSDPMHDQGCIPDFCCMSYALL